MTGLALRSLRYRTGGFVASFLAMFLGAAILMTFAAMLDTAAEPGVDAAGKEVLQLMAMIVGGWGLVIVTFAVMSTLTLSVRQRSQELAVLKNIGATPFQLGRMIVVEAAVLALVAAALAIAPAIGGGALLLSVLKDTGQVAPEVGYSFGPIAVHLGLGITFLAAVVAAVGSVRRATRMRAREAVLAAAVEDSRPGRLRLVAAWVVLAGGISCGVVTATVFHGQGIDAMATGGQAAILSSVGLALLAPVLLRKVTAILAAPLQGAGAAGYLTLQNIRRRTHQLSGALVPIILFTGIATGTLYMQSIENSAVSPGASTTTAADAKAIETLNFVVVGMIAIFAAIMLVNTLIAATTYRRQEFGQQRLAGSTPGQVLQMVGFEGAALATTGVLVGSLASVFAVIPYSIARTGSVFPDSTIAIYLGIIATAVALTMAASLGSARRAIRTPAVEAVAA
jgi:ABC-type antimicrobial peptide transport system permease subunit